METYKNIKSREYFNRALKTIPGGVYGHLGPAEGCFIPVSSYPLYISKAQGTYIWDIDGNRYIDYMCAYGPNVLGYNDPDVLAAAEEQLRQYDCATLPSTKMIDLAELMVDTVKSADWAFFAKNGGDVTTFSIMIARSYTRRDKLILVNGYYHGVAAWAQKKDCPGVTAGDIDNNLYVDFNNIEQLKQVLEDNKGQVAAFIATPYNHINFLDNELPQDGYWQQVRQLCTDNGVILIIDDVRSGFRLDIAGSDHYYGFEADMICFCKALANGFNISCLCGKDFLKAAVGSIQYTGSYWLSAVPMAAALVCINKLKKLNAPVFMKQKATKLCAGLVEQGLKYGFDLRISGEPALFYMRIVDKNYDLMLHQEWVAECIKRGVFFTSHHNHFMNMSITDEDIAYTIEVAEDAFKVLRANHSDVEFFKK